MTREEAIYTLKNAAWLGTHEERVETEQAIDMAIEALNSVTDSENGAVESKNDVIKRQDAIKTVIRMCAPICDWELEKKAYTDCVVAEINSLPSAEAVKGEWIDIDSYYRMATCSHCLKVTMFEKWGEYTRPYNFCPNCGARMNKGGESE